MQIDPSALERARTFIGSVGWTFAKTRASVGVRSSSPKAGAPCHGRT
jgi:hypothetical protein